MIKKALAFVALMAVGLGVMHYVVGWENFARVRGGAGDGEEDGEPSVIKQVDEGSNAATGAVVGDLGDANDDAIRMSGSGALHMPRTKVFELANGTRRALTTYVLDANDSQPHPTEADRMQLSGVTVKFFDIDDDDPADPKTTLAGTLTAATAELQLGRDARGRPSIREDRDIALTEVLLVSDPQSRIEDLEMRMPRLLMRQRDEGYEMRTPNPDDPFAITLGGDDPMRLTGQGLRAVLPSSDPDKKNRRADESEPARIELHILSAPVMIRGDAELRASGSLDYVEDLTAGIAKVSLEGDVIAEGLLPGDARQDVRVVGDRLEGTLTRKGGPDDGRSDRKAAWRRLQIEGSPVEMTGAVREEPVTLRAARVDASPAVNGQPAIFTASGDPELEQGDGTLRFGADRIHLVRVRNVLDALHRPFGFGRAFGGLVDDLFVFEGAAHVTDKKSGTTVRAAEGMRVLRSAGSGTSLTLGFGAVQVEREGLTARGSQGMQMIETPDGARTLRLGPEMLAANADAAEHRFSVVRGGDQPLDIEGSGFCTITRAAGETPDQEGPTTVALRSPTRDLRAALPEGGVLRDLSELDATVDADGALLSFDAKGAPCVVERDLRGERVIGRGDSLQSAGAGKAFVLRGAPAVVERPVTGDVIRGAAIEIFAYGERATTMIVHRIAADEPAHVEIQPSEDNGLDAAIAIDAERVRFVPRLVAESALRAHLGGMHRAGWTRAFAASLRSEHVLADGDVDIDRGGDRPVRARAERFVSRLDGSAAVLFGQPAAVRSTNEDGSQTTAFADTLRMSRGSEKGQQQLELLPSASREPALLLRASQKEPGEPAGAGGMGSGARDLHLSCDGPITAEGSRATFGGAVLVRELAPRDGDGANATIEFLPEGLQLKSEQLDVEIGKDGGVRKLIARGAVELRINGAVVRGDELELDLFDTKATVRSKKSFAEVTLPDAKVVRGTQLEVDYIKMLVTGWNIRIEAP